MATRKAHAAPTKEFFVRMITKDIDLEDCILDLIDNCLDGARQSSSGAPEASRYANHAARIELTRERFLIEDNCGGISVDQAIDYAFHFGRRKDAPAGNQGIGLYGIGMKRAIFKMGNKISIHSSTFKDSFRTDIDVDAWLAKPPLQGTGDLTRRIRTSGTSNATALATRSCHFIADALDEVFTAHEAATPAGS